MRIDCEINIQGKTKYFAYKETVDYLSKPFNSNGF